MAGFPIVVTDRSDGPGKGQVAYANPAFLALTGYSLNELTGSTMVILHGEDTDELAFEEMRQDLHQGRAGRATVFNRRKTGEQYLVSITAAPLLNADGDADYDIAIEELVDRELNPWVDLTPAPVAGNVGYGRLSMLPEQSHDLKIMPDGLSDLVQWYNDNRSADGFLYRQAMAIEGLRNNLATVFAARRNKSGEWMFTVWGSGLCQFYGFDYTGTVVGQNTPQAYWELLVNDIQSCVIERALRFAPVEIRGPHLHCVEDRVLMPMASAGRTSPDQVLGVCRFRTTQFPAFSLAAQAS